MYTLSLKTTRISNLSLHHHQESTDIIRYYGMIISQQTFLVRSFPSLKRLHVPPPHLFQQFFLLRGKGQAFPERCLIIVRGRQSWSWPRARFAFIKRKRPSPRKIRPWKISPSSGELHFSSLNRRCERDARVHNDSPQDWSNLLFPSFFDGFPAGSRKIYRWWRVFHLVFGGMIGWRWNGIWFWRDKKKAI